MLLCRSVAAHVHAETIPAAIKPGFTFLLAVLNSSLVRVEKLVYLFCASQNHVSSTLKEMSNNTWSREIPIITVVKNRPMPTTTPYPTPWDKTAETLSDMIADAQTFKEKEVLSVEEGNREGKCCTLAHGISYTFLRPKRRCDLLITL